MSICEQFSQHPSGNDAPWTIVMACSAEFRKIFRKHLLALRYKNERRDNLRRKTKCYSLKRYEDIDILRLGKDFFLNQEVFYEYHRE
jgi:hypothetical protein